MTALKKIAAAAFNAGVKDFLNFLATTYPRVHAYSATGQVLPNAAATFTLIAFDGEVYDTDSMHSTTVNPSRITFTTAGLYHIDVLVSLAASTYTTLTLRTRLNSGGSATGGTLLRDELYPNGAPNMGPFTFNQFFNAGDYIEFFVAQAGGTPTTAANALGTRVFASFMATV
jgi:hypothetical protein